MFEEKQLLAMNSELQESLAMERRSINRLLRQIHQLESKAGVAKLPLQVRCRTVQC